MDAREGIIDEFHEAKQVYNTLASGGLGSTAAITLAGVASLVVAGVILAKHEYNQHQSKNHLKEIRKILELYKDYLVDIDLPEGNLSVHLSLPPPFELDSKENPKSATALKLNKAIRQDLVKDKSISDDAFLNLYSRHIKNAKTLILGFYDVRISEEGRTWFTRGSEDDVTSSVLTYLLVMLSEHCTKFEGYQVDIAYLDALIKFITGFASLPRDNFFESKNPKKRQRFERLMFACNELRIAKKLLEDHSNSRTLKSYVDELMSACDKDFIPDLLNFYAKFIVPEEHWKYVDAATPELLADGLIRPEYKNSHTFLPENKIKIPESIFKIWLQQMSKHYLNPEEISGYDLKLQDEYLNQIKELFELCQNFLTLKAPETQENEAVAKGGFVTVGKDKCCKLYFLSQMPLNFKLNSFLLIKHKQNWRLYKVNEERQVLELNLDEVKSLNQVLSRLPANRLPEQLSKKEKKRINKVLTAYQNTEQLKSRANIFLRLTLLFEQLNDLSDFCKKLSDCIRDLGEIYVTNPHHCNFIFDSLSVLGKEIDMRISLLLKDWEKVKKEQDGANDMLIQKQLDLETQLNRKLILIRTRISTTINGIMDKHRIHSDRWGNLLAVGKIDPEQYDRGLRKKAIQEMLGLASKLSVKYNSRNSVYELSSEEQSLIKPELSQDKESLVMANQNDKKEMKVLISGVQLDRNLKQDSTTVLAQLRQRIDQILDEEQPDNRTRAAYEHLYRALDELVLKARIMHREPESHRQTKAAALKELSLVLCNKTLSFLNNNYMNRISQANQFRDEIKDELSAVRNQFLDQHKSIIWKVFRMIKELTFCLFLGFGFYKAYRQGGFFRTSTRAKAFQLGEAYDSLAKKLTCFSRGSNAK